MMMNHSVAPDHDLEKRYILKEKCSICMKPTRWFRPALRCTACCVVVHESCKRNLEPCIISDAKDPSAYMFTVDVMNTDGYPSSKGVLHISALSLRLLCLKTEKVVACWPFAFIRKYAFEKNLFSFEAGRRCQTGEGIRTFQTNQAEEIFLIMREWTRRSSDVGSISLARHSCNHFQSFSTDGDDSHYSKLGENEYSMLGEKNEAQYVGFPTYTDLIMNTVFDKSINDVTYTEIVLPEASQNWAFNGENTNYADVDFEKTISLSKEKHSLGRHRIHEIV